ncbi:MAG: glycosyltransferase family 4 protein [Kiritimatiellae bacterium]|nr:glycosyltransferase family 4 protein [Kiritimatiellia bacterium]
MTTPNTGRTDSVLFLDKVLLSPKTEVVRGVELFNLNLIRDLVRIGAPLTVAAHPSWRTTIEAWCAPATPILAAAPGLTTPLVNGFVAAWQLRRSRFSVLLLANVANSLIPAVRLLHARRVVPRCVLIAHREPSRRFVLTQSRIPTTAVAVNGKIAAHFNRKAYPVVDVHYGITNADLFFPPPAPGARKNETTHFCVIGQLDNPWKGADTAIGAFERLPPETRTRCRLHLASFRQPPARTKPGITAYAWMPFEQIPAFLRRMDVMIVPSRDEHVMRETFSQAIVQGMLSGLPILASDLPILKEKLDSGGGLLFTDTAQLASHMAELARDPARRRTLGAEGRRTALARYVWRSETFVSRYLFPEPARK